MSKLETFKLPEVLVFLMVEKLNISAIYKSISIFLSANLPFVFIYKFCQLQPPGEPREYRLGEVLQGRAKSKVKLNLPLVFISSLFIQVS